MVPFYPNSSSVSAQPLRVWIIIFISVFTFLFNITGFAQYDNNAAERTAKTVGLITELHHGSRRSSGYTVISFDTDSGQREIVLHYALKNNVYQTGDKLMVEYDPQNLGNAKILMEEPYFEKDELPDITVGIILSMHYNYCYIAYQTFPFPDRMDVKIKVKKRYLSPQLASTLKENSVYKIKYNKNDFGVTKAEILFDQLIDDKHPELNKNYFRALECLSKKSPGRASRLFNKCIEVNPYNTDYYFHRAKAQQRSHRYRKSLESINKYISMNQDKKAGYLRRAILYIELKEYEKAKQDITNLYFMDPNDDKITYLQGVLYYYQKEYEKAAEYINSALSKNKSVDSEVYYQDLGVALRKLNGRGSDQSKTNFEASKIVAHNYRVRGSHGRGRMHASELYDKSRGFYASFTSDNSYSPISSTNSNMQLDISVPYSLENGGQTHSLVYNKIYSLKSHKSSNTFTIGTISAEIGGFRNIYWRIETGLLLKYSKPNPAIFRTALGYNVKFTKSNNIIFRPEIGFSYLGPVNTVGGITLNQYDVVTLFDEKFKNKTEEQREITIRLHQNVVNFSPALGLWLLPYSSRIDVKVSVGYNFNISQNYYLDFSKGDHDIKRKLSEVDIKYLNTNGKQSQFYNYNGLFMNLGIGFRL